MKEEKIYRLVHVLCFLLGGFWFFEKTVRGIQMPRQFISCLILFLTVFVVYGLKALRLYLVLAGSGISVREHLRQYCKTAFISIVFPLKLGDIFRAYCYGYTLHTYGKGIMAVLLDRFSDTLALLTILFLILFIQGSGVSVLAYLLLVFMLLLTMLYRIFPGFYQYWNQYLLAKAATAGRLRYLALLYHLHKLYEECRGLVHGRIFGLYLLSLMAWSIEIGGAAAAAQASALSVKSSFVSVYLQSALGVRHLASQQWFLVCSMLVLAAGILLLYGTSGKEREK